MYDVCHMWNMNCLPLWKHMGLSPIISVVCVSRSSDFDVMFCWSFCVHLSFSFGHCIFCPSLTYGFWLPFVVFKLFLGTSHHCIHTLKLILCSENAGDRNQSGINILSWHVDPRECDRLTLLFEMGQLQWKQFIYHLYCKATTLFVSDSRPYCK